MFNPEDYLRFVKIIREESKLQTAAGIRTALNRTYFSALVNAKERLEKLGMTFPATDEMHQAIIEEVKGRDSTLGDKLNKLYDLRLDADYNLELETKVGLISPAYGMASRFNAKARSVLI